MSGWQRFIGPGVVLGLLAWGLGALLGSTQEASQLAREALALVFSFFTTPFILETTVALLGLLIVVSLNRWRLSRDGDEWVEVSAPSDQKGEDAAE